MRKLEALERPTLYYINKDFEVFFLKGTVYPSQNPLLLVASHHLQCRQYSKLIHVNLLIA